MKPPLKQRGDIVGPYVIQRWLGAGREGDVFLAQHSRKKVQRSVKLLRGRNTLPLAEHTVAYYRRLVGIPSVKQLRGWGVLYDQAGVGRRPWLAFDYVEGVTLARQIALGRVKNPLAMLLKVCAALLPIHRRGMAIGDFDRGRNVLVERASGRLRFCDLDAGVPNGRPPVAEDDFWDLASLARVAYRRLGRSMPPRGAAAILDAGTLEEAMCALEVAASAKAKARPP